MNFKKLMAVLMVLASFGFAFAEEEGKYLKLTIGYAKGGVNADWDYYNGSTYNHTLYYSGFEIMPAFGFQLPVLQDKPVSLDIEAQLPIVFGGDEDGNWKNHTFAVEPSAMCMVNWHFGPQFAEGLQKLVPYGGLGFGIPIEHVSYKYKYVDHYDNYGHPDHYYVYEGSSNELGFKINMTLGARYDFTKQIGALVEWNGGVIGEWSNSMRIGGMFRF